MTYSTFIGIDISKKKIDICVMTGSQVISVQTCKNSVIAISKALNSLLKGVENTSTVLVCAEHTGHYSYCLIESCKALSLSLWLEGPAQIKWSSGVRRGKNDKVDAEMIARYAYRFQDKALLYSYPEEVIMELRELNAERTQHNRTRAKEKAILKDQEPYLPPAIFKAKAKRIRDHIKFLDKIIKEIDLRIAKLIRENAKLKRYCDLMMSIDGVGKHTAIKMIISTWGFTRFKNAKKFCCHAGVAPFAYLSGTSQHSKWKVSHRADKSIKSTIHMAALSASRVPGELREYYLRKQEEGKNKMLILNTIRAKLIHRIFAVISRNQKYEKNYIPILD